MSIVTLDPPIPFVSEVSIECILLSEWIKKRGYPLTITVQAPTITGHLSHTQDRKRILSEIYEARGQIVTVKGKGKNRDRASLTTLSVPSLTIESGEGNEFTLSCADIDLESNTPMIKGILKKVM